MNINRFEIIDDNGVIESPLLDLEEALQRLDELHNEGFNFVGDIKIVEVHYIDR